MKPETRIKRALDVIADCGDAEGDHHKQWVLDQVVRALTGGPKLWEPGMKKQRQSGSREYEAWVRRYEDGEDGPKTYEWDKGIAP